jgi:tRNA threonylcarbamoyladenosine biosynthesis protein TsaE
MNSPELVSRSPGETQGIGEVIGKAALPGDVLLLEGKLGAGKTCLTQGIARGLDIDEYVLSPTFVIMREFYGRLPLYHIDLYRLDNIDETMDLGLDEYLYGTGICIVEWAEKALSILPPKHLMIRIDYLSDTERTFRFEPRGDRAQALTRLVLELCPDNRRIDKPE